MSKAKDNRQPKSPLRDDESFPVYRPDELAAMLGVQVSTLREWRKLGRGPMFIRETPKSVVYLKETVHQWLRSHQQHTQTHWYNGPVAKKRTKPPPGSDESSEPSGASGNAPQQQ